MIKLGSVAKDSLTGLEGIVVGRTEYLIGSTRYALRWTDPDFKDYECVWLEESQIQVKPS